VTECVCELDLFCCIVNWDAQCAAKADQCGTCSGNCCVPNGSPGCSDQSIEACVCADDEFCCEASWDGVCSGLADTLCLGCN
jgi:hypothetical protein